MGAHCEGGAFYLEETGDVGIIGIVLILTFCVAWLMIVTGDVAKDYGMVSVAEKLKTIYKQIIEK